MFKFVPTLIVSLVGNVIESKFLYAYVYLLSLSLPPSNFKYDFAITFSPIVFVASSFESFSASSSFSFVIVLYIVLYVETFASDLPKPEAEP